MINAIKKGLKKRKVKLFLVFLFFSALAWFISNLSKTYTADAVFELEYLNIGDERKLVHASHDRLKVRIEALGFHFLRYSLSNKKVELDMADAQKQKEEHFLSKNVYAPQIEKQLSSSIKLLAIENDTLFFNFQDIVSKKVPVRPNLQLNLAQNYLLDGELIIEPDSIVIKGPKNEVETISHINTTKVDLTEQSSNFSREVALEKLKSNENTSYSDVSVVLEGKVSKFSEKIMSVKVDVINLPKGTSAKTFPEKIDILCKGTLDVLKDMSVYDFQIVANYSKTESDKSKHLQLEIKRKPVKLHSAVLQETKVEYILKRQ